MKKNYLWAPTLTLALLVASCTTLSEEYDSVEQPNEAAEPATVHLRLSQTSWDDPATRAGNELLSPVTLLLVPDGQSNIIARKVVENDDFTMKIPYGEYDIFAVCGLPEDVIPDNLFEEIEIPEAIEGSGLTDFAMGYTSVANDYGKLSSSSVSITAKRQMAWLSVTINDVPDSFSEIALYVKGLAETYNFTERWTSSAEAENQFTRFSLTRKPMKKAVATNEISIPCLDSATTTTFNIIGKTSDGKTLTYTYNSSTALTAGRHLTLNLSISDLVPVDNIIDQEDWNSSSESGTLDNPVVTTED